MNVIPTEIADRIIREANALRNDAIKHQLSHLHKLQVLIESAKLMVE